MKLLLPSESSSRDRTDHDHPTPDDPASATPRRPRRPVGRARVRPERPGAALANGPQFQVNTLTTSEQRLPSVAIDAAGGFVVVWQSYVSGGTDQVPDSIQGQRFDAEGLPLGASVSGQHLHHFGGVPTIGGRERLRRLRRCLAEQRTSSTGDIDYSIQARAYAPDGSPVGDQFRVNTYTSHTQTAPSVSSNGQGAFVIAWQSDVSAGGDTDGFSVQARRYGAAGQPLGDQFQVNTYTTSDQNLPSVAMDPQGRIRHRLDQHGLARHRLRLHSPPGPALRRQRRPRRPGVPGQHVHER